jgi:hypothetical protein
MKATEKLRNKKVINANFADLLNVIASSCLVSTMCLVIDALRKIS